MRQIIMRKPSDVIVQKWRCGECCVQARKHSNQFRWSWPALSPVDSNEHALPPSDALEMNSGNSPSVAAQAEVFLIVQTWEAANLFLRQCSPKSSIGWKDRVRFVIINRSEMLSADFSTWLSQISLSTGQTFSNMCKARLVMEYIWFNLRLWIFFAYWMQIGLNVHKLYLLWWKSHLAACKKATYDRTI